MKRRISSVKNTNCVWFLTLDFHLEQHFQNTIAFSNDNRGEFTRETKLITAK
jgi:hypothetical protein